MLLLKRNVSESIQIGDDVVVTVCKNERGQVMLGIEAPRNVTVLRTELVQNNDLKAIEKRD